MVAVAGAKSPTRQRRPGEMTLAPSLGMCRQTMMVMLALHS